MVKTGLITSVLAPVSKRVLPPVTDGVELGVKTMTWDDLGLTWGRSAES